MSRKGLVLGLVGLALFTAFFVSRGVGEVVGLLREAGWMLLAISLWHLVPLAFDVIAWKSVIRSDEDSRLNLPGLYGVRWTAESINALLPVLSIGGELYKLLGLTRRGISLANSAASIVVDMTMALLSEILFVICGLAAFFMLKREGGLPEGLVLGLSVASALAVILFVIQRGQIFENLARALARIGLGEQLLRRLGDLKELDASVHAIHEQPLVLLHCFLARLAAWVLGTGEVWLGLKVLGHPVSLVEAFILESLCQAVRTAGFAIPGALGVQEGGYVLIGRSFGLDDSTALALSLARRIRDLTLGIPMLALWQLRSGKSLLQGDGSERL